MAIQNLKNNVADFMALCLQFLRKKRRVCETQSILVVGGGPVGLTFATSLAIKCGGQVGITVCDGRWTNDVDGLVVWKDGVIRRDQVVTLQSKVTTRLPDVVENAILPETGFDVIWPSGGESPEWLGPPKNIRIRDVEDRLLSLANTLPITLRPGRMSPQNLKPEMFNLIVMADGPRSKMRDHFIDKFGRADSSPYSVNGKQVEDIVLGLRVKTKMPSADQVVMTVAQQRFLMNVSADGEGYLYIRLTKDEAKEVRGRTIDESKYRACSQADPCLMRLNCDGRFRCDTHNTVFAPSEDPASLLWPRVQESLKLFDVRINDLRAVTAFRLKMEHRPRFVVELSPTGVQTPVFGALIGDAANAIHFWPGRGLNHGLSSAVSLARTLIPINNRGLRMADFVNHEAAMHALQLRHKDRAWRNMVHLQGDQMETYATGIARILNIPSLTRAKAQKILKNRIRDISERLSPRLAKSPDVTGMISRLDSLNDETLIMMAELGPWETHLSGGPEVDLDSFVA